MWARFWMQFAGLSPLGRFATWLATWLTPPFYGRVYLAAIQRRGFVSPSAVICHKSLHLGTNVFIDDRVLIYQDIDGGPVELGDRVHLHRESIIQTGAGGSLTVSMRTHIQPRCQFSAYKAPIRIGCRVEIAPYRAFYSYSHGMEPEVLIKDQPLRTKGGIIVKDNVWLGVGVTVLDGVTIGKGAVVGAGAVVTHDVPEGAIVTGVPDRVVKTRQDLAKMAIK